MENASDPFVTRLDEVQDFDFDEPIEEDDEPFVAAVNRLETRDDDLLETVLEGAMRSQVNDGPVTTYRAGESFSDLPGDRHGVSENASTTKPMRLLAVFVVDTDETTLTRPHKKWRRPSHRSADAGCSRHLPVSPGADTRGSQVCRFVRSRTISRFEPLAAAADASGNLQRAGILSFLAPATINIGWQVRLQHLLAGNTHHPAGVIAMKGILTLASANILRTHEDGPTTAASMTTIRR